MRPVSRLVLCLWVWFSSAAQADDVDVPAPLRDWQGWVLDGKDHLRCPFLPGTDPAQPDSRTCLWPGALQIDVDDSGAQFLQRARADAPGWLALPGDRDHWPQDVRLDGAAARIADRGGVPSVWLIRGEHALDGRLRWPSAPAFVAVPDSIGLVRLRINGRHIERPERADQRLRLGATQAVASGNQLALEVHRKLIDSLPGVLVTNLRLQVAGAEREESLAVSLPAGFVPMSLSGALPARFDPDGRLRVQLRPGTWLLSLVARAPGVLTALDAPAGTARAEVWSFEGIERLRTAALEGGAAVDPTQAGVPSEWQSLPAMRVEPGAALKIVERSRARGDEEPNQIMVQRKLWLDFDGGGYTFRDQVGGSMRHGWRLDMAAPYALQGAREHGQPVLVTQSADGGSGVEVRAAAIALDALGRIDAGHGALPASGWTAPLQQLTIDLQLPPGHRLLAAPGSDESPSAWLSRWRLLDIFLVLLIAVIAFRVAGWPAAVIAGFALTLAHQEMNALTWALLNLLIAIALASAAPEGRLRLWAGRYRMLAFLVLAVLLVPFAFGQVRMALFPQLVAAPQPVADLAMYETISSPAEEAGLQGNREMALEAGADVHAMMKVAPSPPSSITSIGRPTAPLPAAAPARAVEGTPLQSGPGIPEWSYESHRLAWSGPVDPGHAMRPIVLRPWLLGLWRIASVVLLLLLFGALWRRAADTRGWPSLQRWRGVAMLVACALAGSLSAPTPARAQGAAPSLQMPSPELLAELERRLMRAPRCAPDCVSIAEARVTIVGERLRISLQVHALADSAVPMPRIGLATAPDSIELDGVSVAGVRRESDGALRVAIDSGVHRLLIEGPLPEEATLRIGFPLRPARTLVDAQGWRVEGLDGERLLADSLNLLRPALAIIGTAGGAAAGRPDERFPPFVRVSRTLTLDHDWTVSTQVKRLAPVDGAFTLQLPLLPGESVLDAVVSVRDGRVTLAMPAGVDAVGWQSTLPRGEALRLEAGNDVAWVEEWQLQIGPMWRAEFDGTPEVLSSGMDGERQAWRFEPRPGEFLRVSVLRPEPIEGRTIAFDRVLQRLQVGQRSTETTLVLDYRSTQGDRHRLQLPPGASLQSVTADGVPIAIRDDAGALVLPVQPGSHQWSIAWQHAAPVSWRTRPEAVGLGAPAGNVTTVIALPADRWVLFARGGGVGPAILYWAEIAAFIVAALLLVRLYPGPLRMHEWLLVGLGLSTFSWGVLLGFAVWVFAFDWRRRWAGHAEGTVFNAVQVALAILTVLALGSLLAAIPNGLLGQPDMSVAGIGSDPTTLSWFHDRTVDALPQPVVVSLSLWFYKAAMLAWALWLSFALVRWVRWAWNAYTSGRLWHGDLKLLDGVIGRDRAGQSPEAVPQEPAT